MGHPSGGGFHRDHSRFSDPTLMGWEAGRTVVLRSGRLPQVSNLVMEPQPRISVGSGASHLALNRGCPPGPVRGRVRE
jgi:hypothetical protein